VSWPINFPVVRVFLSSHFPHVKTMYIWSLSGRVLFFTLATPANISHEEYAQLVCTKNNANIWKLGTSPGLIGTPSEQIGFQASEEYASRMSSPRPMSSYHLAHSNASFSSQTHVDSPLRESFAPGHTEAKEKFEGTLAKGLQAQSEAAVESEVEDEDTIHVDAPGRRISKIYGGAGPSDSMEELHRYSSHDGHDSFQDEHSYGAPILASDEVAKEPFGWELQPAVSPLQERHHYEEGSYHMRNGSASSLNGSRPSSRPGSIHGPPSFHVSSSTPLEDLEEYEPLFPEDEKSGQSAAAKRPETAADRLKRPEMKVRLILTAA